MVTKAMLHKLVDELPDEDIVEELQYRLYVLQKIKRGLASIERGERIEHEVVAQRIRERFTA